MDKNEMVKAARALVGHIEADRLDDAQLLVGDLDYELSQRRVPVPLSPEEKKWVDDTLADADREATRRRT